MCKVNPNNTSPGSDEVQNEVQKAFYVAEQNMGGQRRRSVPLASHPVRESSKCLRTGRSDPSLSQADGNERSRSESWSCEDDLSRSFKFNVIVPGEADEDGKTPKEGNESGDTTCGEDVKFPVEKKKEGVNVDSNNTVLSSSTSKDIINSNSKLKDDASTLKIPNNIANKHKVYVTKKPLPPNFDVEELFARNICGDGTTDSEKMAYLKEGLESQKAFTLDSNYSVTRATQSDSQSLLLSPSTPPPSFWLDNSRTLSDCSIRDSKNLETQTKLSDQTLNSSSASAGGMFSYLGGGRLTQAVFDWHARKGSCGTPFDGHSPTKPLLEDHILQYDVESGDVYRKQFGPSAVNVPSESYGPVISKIHLRGNPISEDVPAEKPSRCFTDYLDAQMSPWMNPYFTSICLIFLTMYF